MTNTENVDIQRLLAINADSNECEKIENVKFSDVGLTPNLLLFIVQS